MRSWPLTVRGTGAVALGVACFVLAHRFQIPELLYVGVLLSAAVAISLATLHGSRRAETVTRFSSPDPAVAGDPVEVHIRVEIGSRLPGLQGRWHDRLPAALDGRASGALPPRSARADGGAIDLSYEATALRRGRHAVGPLTITTVDPFGFARRPRIIGDRLALTVTPAIVDLGALTDLPGAVGGSMHTATDRMGEGADNLIPRAYVPGDSMRRIHWRASAHRDELMVRQEEQETTPEAVVVLDRGLQRWPAEAHRAPGEDPGFEAAVSACVSAAARLSAEGYLVRVVDLEGDDLSEPVDASDSADVERLAIDLATLVTGGDATPARLARRLAGALTGPLVLVVGSVSTADVEALAPLARHSALPVLLAVAHPGDALDVADAAGWHTGAIGPDVDLAAAWNTAVDRGGHRVDA